MKLKSTFRYFLIANFIFLISCVEIFDKNFSARTSIIIVQGQITNDVNNSPINIKESIPTGLNGSDYYDIGKAEVSLEVNGNTKIPLIEKELGYYYFPATFKGEIGSKYKLMFKLSNGELFESNAETLTAVPEIKKAYDDFDLNGISDAKGNKSSAFKIYIDTDDPAATKNYYLWNYTLYESQGTCKTCTGGRFYTNPLPEGTCVEDALLKRYNNIFDYVCKSSCWEIFRSTDQNINNDEFYNGKTIKGQLIGKVPVYQYLSALIDIKQYSISEDAYNFIKISQQVGKETGGLADTPPAALIGNVKCVNNPSKNVSGYFIVSGVSKALYWLDKQKAIDQKAISIGLLGGREVKYEPTGPDTTRPPLAPCINSENRTNQKPIGWRD